MPVTPSPIVQWLIACPAGPWSLRCRPPAPSQEPWDQRGAAISPSQAPVQRAGTPAVHWARQENPVWNISNEEKISVIAALSVPPTTKRCSCRVEPLPAGADTPSVTWEGAFSHHTAHSSASLRPASGSEPESTSQLSSVVILTYPCPHYFQFLPCSCFHSSLLSFPLWFSQLYNVDSFTCHKFSPVLPILIISWPPAMPGKIIGAYMEANETEFIWTHPNRN